MILHQFSGLISNPSSISSIWSRFQINKFACDNKIGEYLYLHTKGFLTCGIVLSSWNCTILHVTNTIICNYRNKKHLLWIFYRTITNYVNVINLLFAFHFDVVLPILISNYSYNIDINQISNKRWQIIDRNFS